MANSPFNTPDAANTADTTSSTPSATAMPTAFLEILTPGPGIDLNDVRGAVAVALIETGIVTPDTICTDINGGKIKITGQIKTDFQQLEEGVKRVRQAIGTMQMKGRTKFPPKTRTPSKRAHTQKPEPINSYPGIDRNNTNQPTMIEYLTKTPGWESVQDHHARVTQEAALKGIKTTGR